VNRLDEYVEQDRESAAWLIQSNAAAPEKPGRFPFDDWRDSDASKPSRSSALDSHQQLEDYQFPMSPNLISFIASEASCLPHDLEEAKRAGQGYSSFNDDPSDFFKRQENGQFFLLVSCMSFICWG
jgi:hypothetical protein